MDRLILAVLIFIAIEGLLLFGVLLWIGIVLSSKENKEGLSIM